MPRVFTLCSVVVHAIVVAAALVAPLFAIDALPAPQRPLTFEGIRRITIADVPQSNPHRHPPRAGEHSISMAPDAAPAVVPSGIADETGRENGGARAPVFESFGVEQGLASDAGLVEPIPPPPPPPAQTPIRLHSGMQPPRKIVDVQPVYPTLAQSARVEGVVILEAILAADGQVASVRVLRSIPLLDQAAVNAVGHWRFTPALLNGVAVPVIMTVTVQFTLQGR
jgi:protein TonB